LIGLTGCSSSKAIILHPIEQADIAVMKKDSPFTPKKDGYFLSKEYVKEVMKAKVDSINLSGN
jgi:hypothetical protein